MKKGFIRFLIWIGIIAVLTIVAMSIWMLIWDSSQTTESLKWLQFLQTVGTFLLPPVLCAWWWDEKKRPFNWLKMDRSVPPTYFLMAISIMIIALPAINLLADLNGRIKLPESLDFIEQKLKSYEQSAALLTERFLRADNVSTLLINIGLLALLPALGEELTFRGTLQQICAGNTESSFSNRQHLAIWFTAIIFSAIHMQFYGFIPRMLMGAMFGYIFVWTGSLWIPVTMHFTNNCIAVLAYQLAPKNADTFGAGNTWWVGVISLLITSLGLLIFYHRTHRR